jgi:hypothetical protein
MPHPSDDVITLRLRLEADQRLLRELERQDPRKLEPWRLEILLARLDELRADIRATRQALERQPGRRSNGPDERGS